MGTETNYTPTTIVMLNFTSVKLNNPQMGTETLTIMIIAVWVYYLKVKLNNPHKGTETAKIFGEIRYSIHTR